MNLQNAQPAAMLGGSVPQPVPTQENLQGILEQTLTEVCTSLKYADQLISHVGSAISEDQGQPQMPGVIGKAFEVRSKLRLLNLRLEQLAQLL